MDDDSSLLIVSEFCNALKNMELNCVDGVKRDRRRVEWILKSYARHQGTHAPKGKLLRDIKEHELQNISVDTICSCLEALRKLFVIEDMPVWDPKLRSKAAIRSTATRYFVDLLVVPLGCLRY